MRPKNTKLKKQELENTVTEQPEPSITISIIDFLSQIDASESMKIMFTDFYRKIGINWIPRDQWMDQWNKFIKLSPIETDKARKRGKLL